MYHWHCQLCNALLQISAFYQGPYIEISKPSSKDPLIIALKDTYQDTCGNCENQREKRLAISSVPSSSDDGSNNIVSRLCDKRDEVGRKYELRDEFVERDEHKVFYPVRVKFEVHENGHVLVEHNGEAASFNNPLGVRRCWEDHSDKPLPDYKGGDGGDPFDGGYSQISCYNYESETIDLELFVCHSCLEQLPKNLRDNFKKNVTDFCEKNKNILKFYDDKNKWRDCGYPSLVTWNPIMMFDFVKHASLTKTF